VKLEFKSYSIGIGFKEMKVENMPMCCLSLSVYEGWNFNSGNYLFTTDTK